jgi:hypothetical protein
MDAPLILSRPRLAAFRTCRRRFQLQVVTPVPWPRPPLPPADEARFTRGRQFHQLLHAHFSGMVIDERDIETPQLREWWREFLRAPLPVHQPGAARLLPELTLTVPVGRHLLHGRFDLLMLGTTADGNPFAHIFDWKTSRPRPQADLQNDEQTRLYLALLAESRAALAPLAPEQIRITYWYPAAPQEPRTIRYSAAAHAANWAALQAEVRAIDSQLTHTDNWPLTEDWQACRTCPFQPLCGRQEAGRDVVREDEEMPTPVAPSLEPELP